jgi:membrane-associated protein
MPALAGVFRLHYITFLRFNSLGVVLGIGQFILLGYFFGTHLESILNWLDRFGLLILVLVVGLSLIAWRFIRIFQTN